MYVAADAEFEEKESRKRKRPRETFAVLNHQLEEIDV